MRLSYAERVRRLHERALSGPGTLDASVRRAAAGEGALAEDLRSYVAKVRLHAYRVVDEDVAALRVAGYTEDQIFELTISAALGAGRSRLDAALAALRSAD